MRDRSRPLLTLVSLTAALTSAKAGYVKLKASGIPFSRPPDYFAEMIKSDAHMEKVGAWITSRC